MSTTSLGGSPSSSNSTTTNELFRLFLDVLVDSRSDVQEGLGGSVSAWKISCGKLGKETGATSEAGFSLCSRSGDGVLVIEGGDVKATWARLSSPVENLR